MLNDVDFSNNANLLVIACFVSLGLGATVVPELFSSFPEAIRIVVGDGIITGSLTAIILNLIFSPPRKETAKGDGTIPDSDRLIAKSI